MPAAHTGYVIWNVRGRNAEGERFLMSDGVAVGYGARATADGHDAIYLVAQENYPASSSKPHIRCACSVTRSIATPAAPAAGAAVAVWCAR
jgi:hypothetical protein